MTEDLKQKIERARELVFNSRHISFATVNADGSPHNSPVRFLYDKNLKYIYWGSTLDAMHSQNITRTGQISAALFDRNEKGGVFIKAENGHVVEGGELEEALAVHNEFRIKEGSKPLELTYYAGGGPQKMWKAEIKNFWINHAEKGNDGRLVKDSKIEITAKDLLYV